MEHRARLSLLTLALAAATGLTCPRPAIATVFMTRSEALEQAFPGTRVERRALVPTAHQLGVVERRARVRCRSRLVTAYLAWRGDTLAGAAFFDARRVRTMPCVFLVVVAPDTTVERVDVVAFHEPPDYQPPARWLALFPRRRLNDGLQPRRDIRNLAGATLTARAVTESVRLALAQYEVLVAPLVRSAPRGGG